MARSKGAAARAKGHAWEAEVAYTHLRPIFGQSVRRGSQSRDGADAPDVVLPPEVPIWVECECATWADYRAKLRQAVEAEERHRAVNGGPRRLPAAFLKDSYVGKTRGGDPPVVAMRMTDYLELLQLVRGRLSVAGLPAGTASDIEKFSVGFDAAVVSLRALLDTFLNGVRHAESALDDQEGRAEGGVPSDPGADVGAAPRSEGEEP